LLTTFFMIVLLTFYYCQQLQSLIRFYCRRFCFATLFIPLVCVLAFFRFLCLHIVQAIKGQSFFEMHQNTFFCRLCMVLVGCLNFFVFCNCLFVSSLFVVCVVVFCFCFIPCALSVFVNNIVSKHLYILNVHTIR